MVECDLPKVEIAGSSPVSRSMVTKGMFWKRFYFVVILLSCNCFLLCSSGSCKWLNKIFGRERQDNEGEESENSRETIDSNKDNNGKKDNDLFGETIENENNNIKDDKDEIDLSGYSLIISCPKCVFVSDTVGVGKTSILNCLLGKGFDKNCAETIVGGYRTKNYKVLNRKGKISIQLWDLSGNKKYRQMTPMYFKGANAIIFVYDITDDKSFNDLGDYIAEVKTEVKKKATNLCPLFLLGNKLDLASPEKKQVPTEDAQKLAEENGLTFLGECSAKNNTYIPNQELYCKQKDLLKKGIQTDLSDMLKDIIWSVHKNQNPSTF